MAEKDKIVSIIGAKIKKEVEEMRPPAHIRDQVDMGYNFESNTLEIFEVRPHFQNKNKIITTPIVKTRFVKTKGKWLIYWMRASGKWESYEPNPEVETIDDFFKVLKQDTHGCFFG